MISKALLSLAVCGVAAVDSETTTRLHHHKHVEAHAHKANAAGIIGAAAVGAAGVGALGTMGSITSNNGVSTSDLSNPADNICVVGFKGLGLTCSLASASNSATLCAAGGGAAGACSWVQDTGGGATGVAPFIVYDDNNRFGLNQCFPNPENFATNGGDCSWWANSQVMCEAAVDGGGARKCIYDQQAVACNNCRAVDSACKNFQSKESCEANAVRTAAGLATACTWGRDKVGGYAFSCK